MMHRRQRGAVLLVALLLVALATTLATFSLQRQDASLRLLEATRDYDQSRWILLGGVHWARTILAEDALSTRIDHTSELWANPLKATQVEDATLTGGLHDQQGLFNLANLWREGRPSPRHVGALRRLLRAIGERPALADAIAAAHPLAEWDELHDVPGCDEGTVARLAQVATLLPEATLVNVNTAPAAVLAALFEGLEIGDAAVVSNSLRAEPANSVDEFVKRLPRPDLAAQATGLAVHSEYFKVRGRVVLRKSDVRIEALLRRQGSALPRILWYRTS